MGLRDQFIAEKKATMLRELQIKKEESGNKEKEESGDKWSSAQYTTPERVLSPELKAILRRGNFKSGKESIRLFTIIECRDGHLFAMDYEHKNNYYLFVFKWFSIIIHAENPTNARHTTRTV